MKFFFHQFVIFTAIILSSVGDLYSQIKVTNSTSLIINSNTNLILKGKSLNFEVGNNSTVINDGIVDLDTLVTVIESSGNPITGKGLEQTLRFYPSPLLNVSIAGLGAELTTTGAPGKLLLVRKHQELFDELGNPSIKRSFEFTVENKVNINASIKLFYDPSEANGLIESAFGISSSSNGSTNWKMLNSIAFPTDNYVKAENLDTLTNFTIFMKPVLVDTFSSKIFCAGDSIIINYSIPSNFNIGNIFTAQLSDANGTFNSYTPIGSVQSTETSVIFGKLPENINGDNYKIRIVSSDPPQVGITSLESLTIKALPSAPDSIVGNRVACSEKESKYFLSGGTGQEDFQWEMTPNSAGVLTFNSNKDSVLINWNTSFSGQVKLSARSSNSCGISNSEAVAIVFVDICTGISEQKKSAIKVFPNPSSSQFTIRHNNEPGYYIIYSSLGATLLRDNLNRSNFSSIDHRLSKGIYFLKVEQKNASYFDKIIVQ